MSDKDLDTELLSGIAPSPKLRRVPKRGPGRPAVIVSNHQGFIDIWLMIISPLCPGFAPMAELENWLFVGMCARGLQSIFLNRGGN